MKGQKSFVSNLCAKCLQAHRSRMLSPHSELEAWRHLSITIPGLQDRVTGGKEKGGNPEGPQSAVKEEGAMSRRLANMTERSMTEGDKSTRKNLAGAEFSEELKKQLEDKIAAKSFRSENAAAFSLADMPVCVATVLLLSAISTNIC